MPLPHVPARDRFGVDRVQESAAGQGPLAIGARLVRQLADRAAALLPRVWDFAPEIVLPTLQHYSVAYPKMENEHGLVCSFNPTFPNRGSGGPGWISQDHFALDQGPVILMIENYRSGLIWRLMRGCPYVALGLRRAGFTHLGCRAQQNEFAIQKSIAGAPTFPPYLPDAKVNLVHMNGDTLPVMIK